MRKFILIGMAVAMLAVPAVASADVQRYQSQDATFTVTQPKDTTHQFDNVWKHDFTVIVKCDGTFSGTGTTTDNGGSRPPGPRASPARSTLTRRVSFKTLPVGGGATFKVTDAAYNVSVMTPRALGLPTTSR